MKRLIFLALVAALSACGTTVFEPAPAGKPYEVLVVAPRDAWSGALGDSLRAVMSTEVDWVNQPEPIFDLLSTPPEVLTELLRRHRNMISVTIEPQLDSAHMVIERDTWAKGQLIMRLSAPSIESAAMYVHHHQGELIDLLGSVEQVRMKERGRKYSDATLNELIKNKFGFSMQIPKGYRLRVDTTNFLWISNEMPLASQGVLIYTFPRVEGGLNPIAERNLAAAHVPGPSDGSYMSTDTIFRPDLSSLSIDGRRWIESRGFWNVKGDFMGGPFMNYITLDTINNRYIGIDLYVLSPSPKYPKRNYIRQLESLILNVKVQ